MTHQNTRVRSEGGQYTIVLCSQNTMSRVTKSEHFPDSKIFSRKNFPDKARKSLQFSNPHKRWFYKILGNPATFSGWSGHFLDRPETFQIVWKLSRSYRHSFRSSKPFLGYLDTFLNYPDTCRIIRKLSRSPRVPGTFLDHPDSF